MPRAACRTAIVATRTGASLEPARSVAHDNDADHVTLTVDGLDDVRRARVIAQELPQAADAHVDAAVEGIDVRVSRLRQTRTSMLRSKGSASRPRSNSVSCVRLSTRLP